MNLVDLMLLAGLAGFILFHLAAFTLNLLEGVRDQATRTTHLDRRLARYAPELIKAEAATNTPQPWLDPDAHHASVLLCLSPSMRGEFEDSPNFSNTLNRAPSGAQMDRASKPCPNTLSIDGAFKGSVYQTGEAPSPASPSTNI